MAIVRRENSDGTVSFWAVFRWNGKQQWELSDVSTDRAARRLERDRKAEVKAGTYVPKVKGRVTVASYLETYMATRTNRSSDNERDLIENHVLSDEEFSSMVISAVRGRDCLRLVERMRARGRLGEKSISTVYGIVSGAFRRAAFDEVIDEDPTPLPKGTLKRKTANKNRRRPYPRHEAKVLVSDQRIDQKQLVWNALAFYTGQREGEVCGRRWRHWLRDWSPLTCLVVDSQYNDQPLKTDDGEDVRPRYVPVHPDLAALLDAWWEHGFELYMLRKPTLDDFIVPSGHGTNISRSRGYERFREALGKVGIENRTLHATRNTFISICRSGGAPKDVVERITHNARGDVIDEYTELDWATLCAAVRCFDLSVDPKRTAAVSKLQSLDSKLRRDSGTLGDSGDSRSSYAASPEGVFAEDRCVEPLPVSAGQHPPAALALALAAESVFGRKVVSMGAFRAKARAWFARRAA